MTILFGHFIWKYITVQKDGALFPIESDFKRIIHSIQTTNFANNRQSVISEMLYEKVLLTFQSGNILIF